MDTPIQPKQRHEAIHPAFNDQVGSLYYEFYLEAQPDERSSPPAEGFQRMLQCLQSDSRENRHDAPFWRLISALPIDRRIVLASSLAAKGPVRHS
jgi:hypothetical protein